MKCFEQSVLFILFIIISIPAYAHPSYGLVVTDEGDIIF